MSAISLPAVAKNLAETGIAAPKAGDTPRLSRKPPKRTRMRLRTIGDCDAAVGLLIREWRNGLLDSQELSRACNCLSILARMKAESDMEARMHRVEEAMSTQNWRRA